MTWYSNIKLYWLGHLPFKVLLFTEIFAQLSYCMYASDMNGCDFGVSQSHRKTIFSVSFSQSFKIVNIGFFCSFCKEEYFLESSFIFQVTIFRIQIENNMFNHHDHESVGSICPYIYRMEAQIMNHKSDAKAK